MIWKGRELKTYGDFLGALIACKTVEEDELIAAYRAFTPNADWNLGYMAEYFAAGTDDRIRDWSLVDHPVLGYAKKKE